MARLYGLSNCCRGHRCFMIGSWHLLACPAPDADGAFSTPQRASLVALLYTVYQPRHGKNSNNKFDNQKCLPPTFFLRGAQNDDGNLSGLMDEEE